MTTEKFELSDLSELTYNASFGLANSDIEQKSISKGKNVTFKVELVDAENSKTIAVYNEVDFQKGKYDYKNKKSYKIKSNIKNSRNVRLRLVIEDNDNGEYLISNIESKSSVLNKEGAAEIIYNENLVVDNYKLDQNYPNPFNPLTMITYQLPKDEMVTLKVYDMLGKEIATLVNEFKTAGRYDVAFDGSKLSSGIYFYTMNSGEFMATKKLVLIK